MPTKPPVATVSLSRMQATASRAETILFRQGEAAERVVATCASFLVTVKG